MDRKVIVLCALLSVVLGCTDNNDTVPDEDIACITVFVPGLSVRVFDGETREPIACGASVMIGDGGYSETTDETGFPGSGLCVDGEAFLLAYERPGFYSMVVSKVGYVDYVQSDIEVTSDICHVVTVDIDVYLDK